MPDFRSARGVTVIEATIVVATVALLSAILAPAAAIYIDQARQARTREDIKSIGDAINEFIADTGEHQFLRNGSNGGSDEIPPTRADSNRVDILVSDGDIPTLATAVSSETLWTQTVNGTSVDTFSNHLAENLPGEVSTSRYRNPTDVTIAFPGGTWWKRQQADPTGIAEFVARELPFGRFGTPGEVGDVVTFLASPRASWISGTSIVVDGCQSRSF